MNREALVRRKKNKKTEKERFQRTKIPTAVAEGRHDAGAAARVSRSFSFGMNRLRRVTSCARLIRQNKLSG